MRRLLPMLVLLLLCLTGAAAESADAAQACPVWVNGQPLADYQNPQPVSMPDGDSYLPIDYAVTTWRGDSFRTNAAAGTLESEATGLEIVWQTTLDRGDSLSHGFSAGSQPVIVKWPVEMRNWMNLTDEARATAALKEVILPSLDGRIRFLNLADGSATREAIDVGYPLNGAATLHPLSYPVLITGQQSARLRYTTGSIGLHWHELLTQRSVRFIDGTMPGLTQQALTGVFSTSALIDRNTNTAIALSRDGYLYMESLVNHIVIREEVPLSFECRFTGPVIARVSDEPVSAAPVMSGSRIWFGTRASNHGTGGAITCVDTTTMTQLWRLPLDLPVSGLAMERDADGQLWLYAGTVCVDDLSAAQADCQLLCLNADTGEIRWSQAAADTRGSRRVSGAVASPLLGENQLGDLVFFTVTTAAESVPAQHSVLLALSRTTGEIRWERPLATASSSSPVAVYDEAGRGWILQADDGYGWAMENGTHTTLHLLDGLTGEVLQTLPLTGGRPSSPAVYGDMLVIGTSTDTGAVVYGVRIQ